MAVSNLFPELATGWSLRYCRLLTRDDQRATAYRTDAGWRAWVIEVGVLAQSFATPEAAMAAADRLVPLMRLVRGEDVLDDDGNLVILPHTPPPAPRDPRRDPRRGDVVESRDFMGLNRFRVLGAGLEHVRYWSYRDDDEVTCTLDEWRDNARGDKVLERGQG
jgi:hypothetical protein